MNNSWIAKNFVAKSFPIRKLHWKQYSDRQQRDDNK